MNFRLQEKQLLSAAAKRRAFERSLGKTSNEIASSIRKSSDGFLRSAEWIALRNSTRSHYGAICMKCKRPESKKLKINVDHIKPRKFFPHLELNFDNLQILCAPCNKSKGNKDFTDYRSHPLGPLCLNKT